jgi:signal transduction histidine kinase
MQEDAGIRQSQSGPAAARTARELDFKKLFEALPGRFLILTPGLQIAAASDAYLEATMTTREEILGRGLFEIFPENPSDPDGAGVNNLRASLDRVLETRGPDVVRVQRHGMRRPESQGGGFEERYWNLINSPVLGEYGEVCWIIQRVEDVTDLVLLRRRPSEATGRKEERSTDPERIAVELYQRGQELELANRQLRSANDEFERKERARSEFYERFRRDSASMRAYRLPRDLLWLGLAVAVLLAEAVFLLRAERHFLDQNQWSIHTYQVIGKIDALFLAVQDAETGQRGYLLTGDEHYIEPYERGIGEAPERVTEIRRLTADNPRQQERLTRLLPIMMARFGVMSETIDLRRRNKVSESFGVVSSGRGKRLMDQLRTIAGEMKAEELKLLEGRNKASEFEARQALLAIEGGTGVLLAFLIAGALMIRRRTTGLAREAAESARSREAYRLLAGQQQAVREDERARIAREIHDELGQQVTAIKTDVGTAKSRMSQGNAAGAEDRLESAAATADAAIKSVRRIASELRPPLLDFLGAGAAIELYAEEFQERYGIEVKVELPEPDAMLSMEENVALFRIAQESLTNVARYAEATQAKIVMQVEGDMLHLSIRDNGIGFRAAEKERSLGLLGMEERAKLIGASLSIESTPGSGTSVHVRLPLDLPRSN